MSSPTGLQSAHEPPNGLALLYSPRALRCFDLGIIDPREEVIRAGCAEVHGRACQPFWARFEGKS